MYRFGSFRFGSENWTPALASPIVVVTCNGQHLKYLHAEYVLLLSDTIGLVRILMVAAKPYKLKHVPFLFLVPNEDHSSSTVPLYHCMSLPSSPFIIYYRHTAAILCHPNIITCISIVCYAQRINLGS